MIELLKAIQTTFNGASLAGSFANGLEVSVAKDAEALPLCILTIMPPPEPSYQSGLAPYIERVTAQFSVYSTDDALVLGMEKSLDDAFNRSTISLTNDRCLQCMRSGGGNPYRDGDDARVWRADYFYKFWVQRNT